MTGWTVELSERPPLSPPACRNTSPDPPSRTHTYRIQSDILYLLAEQIMWLEYFKGSTRGNHNQETSFIKNFQHYETNLLSFLSSWSAGSLLSWWALGGDRRRGSVPLINILERVIKWSSCSVYCCCCINFLHGLFYSGTRTPSYKSYIKKIHKQRKLHIYRWARWSSWSYNLHMKRGKIKTINASVYQIHFPHKIFPPSEQTC